MTTCNLCGEQVSADEILDHLRLFHPAEYGDGQIVDRIMGEDADAAQQGMETARITIVRRLTDDDVVDYVDAVDTSGADLPLTEALGMMRLAEDTLIRERMDGA